MLKAWNRKVRMITAMISACTVTRRVSANPPSRRFSSVDTLIGFPIGLTVNIPALDPERFPHPLEILDREAGAEIRQIDAAPDRLVAAGDVGGTALDHRVGGLFRRDRKIRFQERAVEVRTETPFRPAGSSWF